MKRPKEQSLLKPTGDLVRTEVDRFDQENNVPERALTELVKQFPKNSDESHILLKVAAINQLYSTQIYTVRIVATHIAKLDIDAQLDDRSLEVVDQIALVRIADKQRNNLSFASKYCSWHHPESYPICDAYTETCLWAYRQQFGLSFARKDLWKYRSFVLAVMEFRDRFELHTLTFKQIDKFLFLKGAALIEARERVKGAMVLPETILEVGAEGGSIMILRDRKAGEDWSFQLKINETALYDLLSEEDRNNIGQYIAQTGYIRSFHEALGLLDRYPLWFSFYPLKVHSEFLDTVLLEVSKRGGPSEEARWRETLKSNDSFRSVSEQ